MSGAWRAIGAVVDVRPLEQAQADLLGEDALHDLVDGLHGDEAALHRFAQVGGALVGGQLDVQPGPERHGRRLRGVLGEVVVLVEEADADVVGHDQAIEAPLFAQHLGEQVVRRVAGLVVDVVVRGHHGSGVRLLDRHLEGEEEGVVQLAPAQVDGPVIARALAEGVARVVLEGGQDVALLALQAAHEARTQHAHEIGVLAQGLLGAAPAHVAGDVEHRGQALVAAHGADLASDRARGALDQLGIPGGAVRERGGKHGRAARHEAHQALLVRQRGNAEAGLLAQELLEPVEGTNPLARVDAVAAQRTGDLAQAVNQALPHHLGVGSPGEVVLPRAVAAVLGKDQPERVHLGDLLVDRHAREQVLHAFRHGPLGVLVWLRHGEIS